MPEPEKFRTRTEGAYFSVIRSAARGSAMARSSRVDRDRFSADPATDIFDQWQSDCRQLKQAAVNDATSDRPPNFATDCDQELLNVQQ